MTLDVDRSLRLPESEYFAEPQAKSGIALHHTVCDAARTTLALWRRDKATGGKPNKVATIYEAFDPAAWAWQFGLSWPEDERIPFEQRFIGIEITSEGGLTLVAANADAYESGYRAAFTGYQDLSARYVAQLRKPRITLGRSFSLIAAAGAGFVLARATHE